jgi:hypothetical protein
MLLRRTLFYSYAECHCAECCYAEYRCAECRFAECHYTESCGAIKWGEATQRYSLKTRILSDLRRCKKTFFFRHCHHDGIS